jgi:hypothetical protein
VYKCAKSITHLRKKNKKKKKKEENFSEPSQIIPFP